ncbi:AarF/ABC1/UbiB kinase family protein [Microbacterium sp.]|uniref:ABC1 kinase family protein n=1 Tax=Microbacterium sp. TaxID=51671 RepID=UPI002732C998|nr:AarF/UbiB family protein [Microbacterium sp.]MDP3950072.1 AarF/UbiB family protein [Microbacterium sp.]
MAGWFVAMLVVTLYVIGLGLIVRWLLGISVGWMRTLLTGVIGFFVIVPATALAVGASGIIDEERMARGDMPVGYLLILLVCAIWVFALGAVFLAGLEFVWPSHKSVGIFRRVRSGRDLFRRSIRYAHILRVAMRHGLGPLIRGGAMRLDDLGPPLVRALNDAGVTFVKIGQVLSSRRDILPAPLANQLATLQTRAAAEDWSVVESVLIAELGKPLSSVFAHLDTTPLAAASIGQVHSGTLLAGDEVVVKVQRPHARAQVEADIDIALRLCRRIERRSEAARRIGLHRLMNDLASSLRTELDYRAEARNLALIEIAANRAPGIMTVPRLHPSLTTRRVLTMDRAPGRPLAAGDSFLDRLDAGRRHEIAENLVDSVLHQILVDGIFHADLHPGNIMIRDDGTLSLIDFGSVAILDREQRELLVAFLASMRAEDAHSATVAVRHLTMGSETRGDQQLLRDLGELFTVASVEQDTAVLTDRLLNLFRNHELAVPGNIAAAVRTLASLQEAVALLDDGSDYATLILARVNRISLRLLNPTHTPSAIAAQTLTVMQYLRRVPSNADALTEAQVARARSHDARERDRRVWRLRVLSSVGGSAIGVVLAVVGLAMMLHGGGLTLPPDVSAPSLIGAAFASLGLLVGVRSGISLHRLTTEVWRDEYRPT